MKFGTHLSIAKGLGTALKEAHALGHSAVQIFTASPQKVDFSYDKVFEQKEMFVQTAIDTGVTPVVHASLVVNFSGDSDKTVNLSINSLVAEMKRCEMLGIKHIVMHPGSNEFKEKGLRILVNSLNTAMDRLYGYGKTYSGIVLIETMAQSGGQVCITPSDYEFIFKNLRYPELFGICFDTAHVFATDVSIEDFITGLDGFGLTEKVKVVHFNDSKMKVHSHKDRHEDMGKGNIPTEDLGKVLKAFPNAIFITEPPTEEGYNGVKICAEAIDFKL